MKKELEELVVNNLGLVYDVVNKHKTNILSVFEYDDAIQMGMMALMKAANTYDSTRQVAFSTYAYTCIKNHLSAQVYLAKNKNNHSVIISLDANLVEDDDKFSLNYILSDDYNLVEENEKNNQIELLYKYINELENPFQRNILLLRLKDKTFNEISQILNSSIQVVYPNYVKGLNILRNKFNLHRGDYYEE